MPHGDARGNEQQQQQPAQAVSVYPGEVIAHHQHDHREREVVVVDRHPLGARREGSTTRSSCRHRCDERALRRHDGVGHVGRHDCPEHRADVKKSRASTQKPRELDGNCRQPGDPDNCCGARRAWRDESLHGFVQRHSTRNRRHAHQDRQLVTQRRDGCISEYGAAAEVVHDHQ